MSQIEELRQIIVGDNTEQLDKLKQRVENIESRTRDVLEVLPPAIIAGVKQDNRLIDALQQPVTESMKQAIRAEPAEYADILYPVMGPSIRRAIAQAISSLLVTINQTVESATSAQGIRLRIQSMRTGVPYAELVLRQSLLYKVEHVYLIDRDSGMMIAEAAGEGVSGLDSDAVSAMFSAIQSFVQDSFSHNIEDRLTDLKVGEHKVWITHGPRVMLACVIYGVAPERLKWDLYDALDGIRTDYSMQLNSYVGDSSAFVDIDRYLQPLLRLRLRDDAESTEIKKPTIAGRVILTGFVLGVVFLLASLLLRASKLSTTEHYLKGLPGLVVTDLYWRDKQIVVEGLQDPVVQIPYSILRANGIDDDTLVLQTAPFQSLDPDIEQQRLSSELAIPAGVSFNNQQNRLQLTGQAPINWLLANNTRLRQLALEQRLDLSTLTASKSSSRAYLSAMPGRYNAATLESKVLEISSQPWLSISPEIYNR